MLEACEANEATRGLEPSESNPHGRCKILGVVAGTGAGCLVFMLPPLSKIMEREWKSYS